MKLDEWLMEGLRYTEIGDANDEVGNHKRRGAVKAIGALFDKCCAVFKERRNVGNSHE